MSTFIGSSFYHVEAARTNRQFTFQIVVNSGVSNAFVFIDGTNAFPPFTAASGAIGGWYGINGGTAHTAPTANQIIANYRADYVARYLSIYAILVDVQIASAPYTDETNNALNITYETYVSNVYPSVSDIVDTLGVPGGTTYGFVKTKPGLQTLATDLISTASLDGGNTLLFSANPNLPDGTASSAVAITSLTCSALTTAMS